MAKTKGARPSPKKPESERLGHRRSTALTLMPASEKVRVPPLPHEYMTGVRRAWRSFWRSPIAQAVDREADMTALLHWAWCLNEMETVLPVLAKARLISTPGGQPTLNPLASYVKQLREAVQHAEIEFGMSPLSRSRLGLTIGQAKLTAQELNRRLDKQGQEPARDLVPAEVTSWEAEWQEV